jgi:glycosyltransferase involved in cell wall biosynthesis
MRCPSLTELPPPPPGKTGWPWTEETRQAASRSPGGQAWPMISVTTPNYNSGQFLEETIRSVLLQGYPSLEYFVIDGGSNDNSVEVIRKYEKWLAYWVTEPDGGQAQAINKGFQRAKGDMVQWINSDDLLTPGALIEVGRLAITTPAAMVGGGQELFGEGFNPRVVQNRGLSRKGVITFWRPEAVYAQPALFVPRMAIEMTGLLDESLYYCMDLDWFIRVLSGFSVVYTSRVLARFRLHPDSKSVRGWARMARERDLVSARYWDEVGRTWAEREASAYGRREAWRLALFQLLNSEDRTAAKISRLVRDVRKSPWRLSHRVTWSTLRRIVIPC